jgi:transcriptional regulator with XRE-family HTH domain
VTEDIVTWLASELKTRGWSHRELARRAGLSQTAVSTVLSGQRQPGWDFCVSVAKALGESPEQMFRRAGLLPALPAPEEDATLRDLIEYARHLSAQERLLVLEYTQWRYQQEQARSKDDHERDTRQESPAEPRSAKP